MTSFIFYFAKQSSFYNMRNKIQLLGLLSGVAVIMLFGRIIMVWNLGGIFLIWNLFLAWIPLALAYLSEKLWQRRIFGKWSAWGGLGIWLLFFPNAPYLITDLIHLKSSPDHLLWYDALMDFVFALAGLITGFYSLLKAHRLMEQIGNKAMAWIIVIGSLTLSSYGIYLGRFGRWNSWDVINHPFSLVRYSINSLYNPLAIQLTMAFSFAMLVIYGAFWLYTRKEFR